MKYRFDLMIPLTYRDVEVESDEIELNEQEVEQIRTLVRQWRRIKKTMVYV